MKELTEKQRAARQRACSEWMERFPQSRDELVGHSREFSRDCDLYDGEFTISLGGRTFRVNVTSGGVEVTRLN